MIKISNKIISNFENFPDELIEQIWNFDKCLFKEDAYPIHTWTNYLRNETEFLILMYDDTDNRTDNRTDKLIGTVMLEKLSKRPDLLEIVKLNESISSYVNIYSLGILEEYRNKGFASKLLNEVEKRYKNITLEVDQDNLVAINVYKKRGYQVVCVNKDQLIMNRNVEISTN